MMTETKLRTFLVLSLLIILWLLLLQQKDSLEIKRKNDEIKSLSIKNDSLQQENLNIRIEKGRYEVALDIFLERNPKAASQFGDIISKETE